MFNYILRSELSIGKYFLGLLCEILGEKLFKKAVVYETKVSHTTPWATRFLQNPHSSAETHPKHSVYIVIDKKE